MDNLQLKGNWNTIKGKMKQKYADLSEDDLTYQEGKADEQKKTGKAKEELRKEIESL